MTAPTFTKEEVEAWMARGEWTVGRCPRCGASLLMNRRNAVWCSLVGCAFGVDEPVTIASESVIRKATP